MPRINEGPTRPALIWIGLIVFAAFLLWRLYDVVLIVMLAALLAIMLRGGASWIAARTRAPKGLSLALLALMIVAGAGTLAYWLGPRLLAQGQELASQMSDQIGDVRAHLAQTQWGKPIAGKMSAAPALDTAQKTLLAPAETALLLTFRTLADLVVLAVTTLYFAISPGIYVGGLLRLVPIAHRPRSRLVLDETGSVLRRWALGQLIDMLTVGALTAVGLALAGVPEAYALAILAGLFTFVPYFGAIIAAIPAVMVALTVGWTTALYVILVFVVCHTVEGYIVAPLVQRRLVEIPPAISIIAMTVMGTLFGPLGLVLGTPLAATLRVLVRELYVRAVLGDRADQPLPETEG